MAERSSFVVVANRLPVDEVISSDGERQWRPSPGGLVTALHPVLTEHQGTWIGWAGGDGEAPEPFELEGIQIHPVPLSAEELERYYEGQSNATIWPLYHDAVETPVYKRRWREAYRVVNQRFAEAAAQVAAEGATVWVQDYQLQLVPAMLREMRPDLRIGFFLHIPFPPIELFMQMPFRAEILRGLLGADLVGFQQRLAAQNFVRLARHLLGLRYEGQSIQVDGRKVKAGAFPISIDTREMERMAADPKVQARAKEIRAELGDPETVILGVDRLDYTKGIELRLKAFRELLADGKLKVRRRGDGAGGDARAGSGSSTTRRCGSRWSARSAGSTASSAGSACRPCTTCTSRMPKTELAALYSAADVMMVTPLRDGMNLVAKEYVAVPRRSGRGAGAQRVRRGGDRAAAGVPLQPARPGRRQGRADAGRRRRAGRAEAPDAGHAAAPAHARRGRVGPHLPQRARRPGRRVTPPAA